MLIKNRGGFMCLPAFRKKGNFLLKISVLLPIIILSQCGLRESVKRPDWIKGSSPPYYVGQSSLYEDKKKALDDAFYNAINQFYAEELGITIRNETMMKKRERGDTVFIDYESSTKSYTNAVSVRVKKIDEHYEKEKGKYRAYIQIYIPEEERIKAKKEAEEYKKSIEESVEKEFQEAENFFNRREYGKALPHYEYIKILLDEVSGIFPDIRTKADARIKTINRINPPEVRLKNLKPTENYFRKVDLIRMTSVMEEEIPSSNNMYYINLGDTFKLSLSVEKPVYIYILSYWQEEGQVRLLYPNWIENKGKLIKGEMSFPDESGFAAEPPPGSNYLFVIATPFPMNLEKYVKFQEGKAVNFSKEALSKFLRSLENDIQYYDIRKIEVIIKG